jgi:hypothetical protein
MIDANKLKQIQDCKGRLKELVGDEGVLQLALDGIVPHYVIINPLTKEESIWFIPSELNHWFENNYIKYKSGHYTPKFDFIYFNKDLHKPLKEVPFELSKITDLYRLPFENISTPPGIYFLCKDNKIQYVGQASNISKRILTHISEGIKDFTDVYFITCPINRLTELESALIKVFNTPLNQTCKVPPSKKDIEIVNSLIKDFAQ